MTTQMQMHPCALIPDLIAFVNQEHRLPRIGDSLAPWHYRGWLLPLRDSAARPSPRCC